MKFWIGFWITNSTLSASYSWWLFANKETWWILYAALAVLGLIAMGGLFLEVRKMRKWENGRDQRYEAHLQRLREGGWIQDSQSREQGHIRPDDPQLRDTSSGDN